ncbi:MAG: hypothetical protein WAW06_11210 [bacterium]
MTKRRLHKSLACASMALVLNLAALDACLVAGSADATAEAPGEAQPAQPPAQQPARPSQDEPSPDQAAPDSIDAASPMLPAGIAPPHDFRQREGSDEITIIGGAPGAGSDGETDAEPRASDGSPRAPFYRKWWFWTAVGSVAATAVLIGVGGDEAPSNLPDFPNPPER